MKELRLDSKGRLKLDGKPVQAIPVGLPRLANEQDLERFCEQDSEAGANAFLQGAKSVEKTISGSYSVYSKATGRTIQMDGPRVEEYWAVQLYKIKTSTS